MKYPLMIIDGNAVAYRAIFSQAKSMRAPDGTPTGGLSTFLRTLKKLARERAPDYLIICFDGPREDLHRRELYPKYKAGRSGLSDTDFDQLDLIINALSRSDILFKKAIGYEADDLVASIAARYRDEMGVMIVSPDKDMHQCVRDNVVCFDPKTDTTIRRADVERIWGVTPEQIPDFQAVIGDPTDNVPGVEGVGPVTARALFDQYHTLDGILENIDRLTERQRRMFLKTDINLMLQLVSLDETLDLDFDLEDMKFNGKVTTPSLETFLSKLGFK